MDYSDLRIYTKGERLVSKRDGQTYTVAYWDEDALTYALTSLYFRFYVSAWDMETF